MRPTNLLALFGLPTDTPVTSLHASAPVWAVTTPQGRVVLKRTSAQRGAAIKAWTQALASAGVGIVAPLAGPEILPDPQAPDTPVAWVMYPFVTGHRYHGTAAELSAAGALLGRVHAFQPARDFGLAEHTTVRAFPAAEIDELMGAVLDAVERAFPAQLEEVRAVLAERRSRYLEVVLPRTLALLLPLANCSWDHKAANLVFQASGAPVLVDPDNAVRMPRLYDLAITALSFQLDASLHDGPVHPLSPADWPVFLSGYVQHVTWTDAERAAWPDVLLCAWMDESLWQLHAAGDDWHDERLGPALLELLRLPHPYALV